MFGVLIPVGPDARDVSRLHALVGELEQHENRDELHLLVVDDAAEPRDLGLTWSDLEVIRTPLWGTRRPDPLSAHVAGTLEGLRAARGLEFVVKLDTDAAVIGSFSPILRRTFQDIRIGVVGSYDRTSDGGQRDWSVWKRTIERAGRPMALWRDGRRIRLSLRSPANRRVLLRVIEAANRFAPRGAHCLGGAYAVSATFIDSVSLDWRPWIRTRLGEDVVIGLLCSAAGLRMRSLTGRREPFALSWRGLPAPPSDIAARGHSIVHSVKCAAEQDELALRETLQSARGVT